jgi:hypothetical protein
LNIYGDAEMKRNFKRNFDIWEESPEVLFERKTKWHISHLPSLHVFNENIVFITKSETDDK